MFTLDLDGGVMAVAEVQPVRREPSARHEPLRVSSQVGVGFRPALDLMPMLALPVSVALVVARPPDRAAPGTSYVVSGADAVDEVAERIVDAVKGEAKGIAQRYPDVDALDQAMAEQAAPGGGDRVLRRATLLASVGRYADAMALVEEPDPSGADRDQHRRRFARQLARWDAAGRPTPPAVEDTIAALPPRPPLPSFSWAQIRHEAAQRRAATAAVASVAAGRSADELVGLLVEQYAARELDIAPASIIAAARRLHTQAQPFGRARWVLEGFTLLDDSARGFAAQISSRHGPTPSWLQRPERATYRARTSRQYTQVEVDQNSREWLARVAEQAPGRLGPIVPVEVWLDADVEQPDTVAVHIGATRVGRLSGDAARRFAPDVEAAAIHYDELVFTPAQFTTTQLHTEPTLQLRLPPQL